MTRTELLKASEFDRSVQCSDCQSLAHADEPYCPACGGALRPLKESRFASYAIAAFIGIGVVILYWAGRV